MAENVPIVISSNDPGLWGTLPLSHDFYMDFSGIASQNSDLRYLKKFAISSRQNSSMNDVEKKTALAKRQIEWD